MSVHSTQRTLSHPSAEERLWQALAGIPDGTVTTYGNLAAAAGLPGRARWAGQMLSRLPEDTRLPWHRVINAAGRISFSPGSTAFQRQSDLLRAEGFGISDSGKVTRPAGSDLKR